MKQKEEEKKMEKQEKPTIEKVKTKKKGLTNHEQKALKPAEI